MYFQINELQCYIANLMNKKLWGKLALHLFIN